ncbi:hypothetical protein Poli38472_012724 [Pythium oligandrum]|uniref:Uncharacterized protein n=1 Tax=Pythium oligandrum TaxID=41045 RepID=A0A8K1CEH4_PYTOL|nr:hypothetical protein Poli38472_012724 [Pythium oligandrum]|eukprot:TMW61533.1 hypothetical protein Poli38472_012724 [Pythium oligandrum]
MAVDVVHLKRKVENSETSLLEWRRCVCSVTGDGRLVLALVCDDAASSAEDDEAHEPAQADTKMDEEQRVELDLAWQLESIEQKRKCKTRCELTYVVIVEGNARARHTEELMAPSPRHCLQWIQLVQEAEQAAKRRQSMRIGANMAKSAALQRLPSPTRPVETTPVPMDLTASSASSAGSSELILSSLSSGSEAREVPKTPPPRASQHSTVGIVLQRTSQVTPSRRRSSGQGVVVTTKSKPRASVTSVVHPIHKEQPLPREVFVKQLAGPETHDDEYDRMSEELNILQDDGEEEDEEDELVLHRLHPRSTATLDRRRSSLSSSTTLPSRPRVLFSPASSTVYSTAGIKPHPMPIRRSPSTVRRIPRPRSAATASGSTVSARIQRLRRRESNAYDEDDDKGLSEMYGVSALLPHLTAVSGDSREELDILRRVETALRQLERENAQAKEREVQLAHEVQTLQDALRIRTAEKKQLEQQVHILAREREQWKHAAQHAEHALSQLQDELVISQEESQLLQSEKHRLKHQNKELASQMHRLDSLVYGRF